MNVPTTVDIVGASLDEEREVEVAIRSVSLYLA